MLTLGRFIVCFVTCTIAPLHLLMRRPHGCTRPVAEPHAAVLPVTHCPLPFHADSQCKCRKNTAGSYFENMHVCIHVFTRVMYGVYIQKYSWQLFWEHERLYSRIHARYVRCIHSKIQLAVILRTWTSVFTYSRALCTVYTFKNTAGSYFENMNVCIHVFTRVMYGVYISLSSSSLIFRLGCMA